MKQTMKPYVGVCGTSTVDEVETVVRLFEESGFSLQSEVNPMIGLQSSYKVIRDGYSEGNRRVPSINDLPSILEAACAKTFTTLHYFTKTPENLAEEMSTLLRNGRIYDNGFIDAVQINVAWPMPRQLEQIKNRHPDLGIILQIKQAATEGMSKEDIAKKLTAEYKDNVDALIIDASGGLGIELDVNYTSGMYDAIRNGFSPSVNMVLAGGFNDKNVERKLEQLKTAVSGRVFSIDAEGGLRNKAGEGYGNDVLNVAKVQGYIQGAANVLLR